jgi:hypothetical protein
MAAQGKDRLNRKRAGTGKQWPSNYIGERALVSAALAQ